MLATIDDKYAGLHPKQRRNGIIICALLICLAATAGQADQIGQLVQRKAGGQVNWSAGIVGVEGVGNVGVSEPETQAGTRERARANAIAKARNKLHKTLLGLRINTSYRLSDLTKANTLVGDQIRTLVDHLPVIDQLETIRPDGSIAVQLLMSIRGGFSHLVLPAEIREIESITKVFPSKNGPAANSTSPAEADTFGGLIIDARGILVEPALAPKLLDERLEEVYGPTFASREYAVQHGVAGYFTDMSKASASPRMAGQPLIIKAMRTAWPGLCDLVISNVDAKKLRSSSKHLKFLRECRVIIVTDPL